jgi:branched-chain amino acid transport system ATP-binding protein
MAPILEVTGLQSGYGPVTVLRELSFEVGEREIVAVLGPNGAGKSTLLKSIVGLVMPSAGSVRLSGSDVTKLSIEATVRRGLTLVPEGRDVFVGLTVAENLRMGAYLRHGRGQIDRDLDRLLDRFPRLRERSSQLAGTLSGGEQQQLAICRALMSQPRVLLLDEPSLGLAPVLAQSVFEFILELREQGGLAIVVVEQSVHDALNIADRVYVLASGRFAESKTAAEMAKSAHTLEESYLGGGVR